MSYRHKHVGVAKLLGAIYVVIYIGYDMGALSRQNVGRYVA